MVLPCLVACAHRAEPVQRSALETPAGDSPAPSATARPRPDPVVLTAVSVVPPPHPLDPLSNSDLDRLLTIAPAELGCASLGQPNRGALFNGVQASDNELWEVVHPERTWATPETLSGLRRAVEAVHREFPGTPRLHLGDMSNRRGGHQRPHRSHQSGRDADIAYYYLAEQRWYQKVTEDNLDRPRTWALVRALLADPDVEYIFVDIFVQNLLKDYALSLGEDPMWLDEMFGGLARRTPAPIRHTWGHRTHLHVRFRALEACRTGERLYPLLRARRLYR